MALWILAIISLGLGPVEDFDGYPVGTFQRGRLDSWRWSPERRDQARDASRLEIVDAAPEAGRVLRVVVSDPQLLAEESLPVARLAPHYPPEADALVIRLKVVSGQFRIYTGGPTAYYGNSDVYTAVRTIAAAAEPQWQSIELSLNHPLWRNQRRAGVSTGAPRNYYNRWAQEPLSLFLAAGSHGELLIDRIDLAAHGEGRPFPQFGSDAIERLQTICDFEDGRLDDVFNWYMADGETEWFDESWRRTRPLRFTPARLTTADGDGQARRALVCTGPTAEEVHGTGVRTRGVPEANALIVKAWANAPGESNTLVGVGPVVPIDFFVFSASPTPAFNWDTFAPSAALKSGRGPGFDYQLSYRAIRDRTDIHLAIYQTRRFLKPQTWTTLTLPAADFTCIYGHGVDRSRFIRHEPLTLADTVAVGWLNPWCRSGRRSTEAATRVDEIAYVKVPGTPAQHRSYWQISSPEDVEMIDQPSPRGVLRRMLLTNEVDGLEASTR